VMTGPLAALALLSVIGGWVGIPAVLGERAGVPNLFEHFLEPVFSPSTALLRADAIAHSHSEELGLMGLTVLLALAGLGMAYAFYLRNPELARQLAETFRRPYQLLLGKYYVDEIYYAAIIRPLHWLSERVFWQEVDVKVVDGAFNGIAARARGFGLWVRLLQSGNTRSYGAWVVVGALVILSYFARDYVFR